MKFTISAIIAALATARKGNGWQKGPWVDDWRSEKREADRLEA